MDVKKLFKLNTKAKGITLITLIITIIIMLIIAGVAISLTVNQENLFGKANEAVDKWNKSIEDEKTRIEELMKQIDSLDKVEVTDNVTLTKSPSTWVNGDVTVTLSYPSVPTGYVIQYKVGSSGTWTTGTSVVVTENETTVYGRLYNKTIDHEIATNSVTVSNIDKVNPTAPTGIEKVSVTGEKTTNVNTALPSGWSSSKVSKIAKEGTSSVTVKATGGIDSLSGVKGYKYSIDNTNWSNIVAVNTNYTLQGSNISTVYVRTIDNAERESETYQKEIVRMAPIPVGYTVSSVSGENSIENGLVIYEGTDVVTEANHAIALTSRNQYVWIPVEDINDMVMCKSNTASGVCNLVLEENTLKCTTHNSEDLCGRLYGVDTTLKETTSSRNKIYQAEMNFTDRSQTFDDSDYREPDIVIDYDNDSNSRDLITAGIADGKASTFLSQMENDFKEMAKSVAKYGGYYIARYEAGKNGSSKKNQLVLTGADSAGTNYLAGNMWYRNV